MSESSAILENPSTGASPTSNEGAMPVLEVRDVSKRFCRDLKRSLLYGLLDIARELTGNPPRLGELWRNEFWALQDISFNLTRGEVMGLVGLNGCGKTTLMRIISGLIKPTTGRIVVRGRLAPLLALGAGFNQVLTGRENIYTNMSVLGLTQEEITERYQSVVDFSEIGYAIDAPVQTYSSGMVARLGFACAIHTQPDILLIDEVLAVGDLKFRRKCLDRIFQLKSQGMSLVIVHHSPDLLLSTCDDAIYLKKGTIAATGGVQSVILKYEQDLVGGGHSVAAVDSAGVEMPTQSEEAELIECSVESAAGAEHSMRSGDDAVLRATLRLHKPAPRLNFVAVLFLLPSAETLAERTEEKRVLTFVSRREGGSAADVPAGDYTLEIFMPCFGAQPGMYQAKLEVLRPVKLTLASKRSNRFIVQAEPSLSVGAYFQPRRWSLVSSSGNMMNSRDASGGDEEDRLDAIDLGKL